MKFQRRFADRHVLGDQLDPLAKGARFSRAARETEDRQVHLGHARPLVLDGFQQALLNAPEGADHQGVAQAPPSLQLIDTEVFHLVRLDKVGRVICPVQCVVDLNQSPMDARFATAAEALAVVQFLDLSDLGEVRADAGYVVAKILDLVVFVRVEETHHVRVALVARVADQVVVGAVKKQAHMNLFGATQRIGLARVGAGRALTQFACSQGPVGARVVARQTGLVVLAARVVVPPVALWRIGCPLVTWQTLDGPARVVRPHQYLQPRFLDDALGRAKLGGLEVEIALVTGVGVNADFVPAFVKFFHVLLPRDLSEGINTCSHRLTISSLEASPGRLGRGNPWRRSLCWR
ncbi:hypothetical protein D3C86_1179250 [compost metagenome]